MFRPDILGKIIIEGLSDVKLIENTLLESRYFTNLTDIPAWRRAWYAFESEDEVYETAVSEVEAQFAARSELEPTILYHMFGVLLRASGIGVLETSRADILNDGKAYVDEISREGRIFTTKDRPCDLTTLHANSSGLGFSEADSAEFKEFAGYYSQAATIAAKKSYALWARTLIARAAIEATEFMFDLCVNNTRNSLYYDVPILASLPPEEFVTMIVKLPARGQITVFATFKARYDFNSIELALADEKPWLGRVRELLIEAVKAERPLTRYRILQMIKSDLDPILVQAGLLMNSESKASDV